MAEKKLLDIEEIKRLYVVENKNSNEIAKLMNVTAPTIINRLISANINRKRIYSQSFSLPKEAIHLYINLHKSVRQIKNILNLQFSETIILKKIRKQLNLRKPIRVKFTEADLKKYVDDGKNIKEIAKIFNCSVDSISKFIKIYNLIIHKKCKKTYKNNINYKLKNRVSCEIKRALRKNNSSKYGHSCLKFIPYTIADLKEHLEKQFEPWMNWNNHGIYRINIWNDQDQSTWTWQIDHIVPQSILPYTSMEEDNFKKCWSLDNLRPLSAKQNILDGTQRIRHKGKI